MRISDWSSDVCSSDLRVRRGAVDRDPELVGIGGRVEDALHTQNQEKHRPQQDGTAQHPVYHGFSPVFRRQGCGMGKESAIYSIGSAAKVRSIQPPPRTRLSSVARSEEHTSELQSL